MLIFYNIYAQINEKKILKGLTLTIKPGEIHVIMGINGSGKSTLAKILIGSSAYILTQGQIIFNGIRIDYLVPEERAKLGIFLSFQYPIEIPGVSNEEFLRISYNKKRKRDYLKELNPIEFYKLINSKLSLSMISSDFLNRNVNEGFSGGEKKKNEILQMMLLNPIITILDEIDSGLDIDALYTLSLTINNFFSKNKSLLLITHYQRLLNYIKPDFIHILHKGKFIKTDEASLALKLEHEGYEWLLYN